MVGGRDTQCLGNLVMHQVTPGRIRAHSPHGGGKDRGKDGGRSKGRDGGRDRGKEREGWREG